jgi:hypothetical protein
MKKYLANALSINMLPVGDGLQVWIHPVSPGEIPQDAISVIGHEDTAQRVSALLGWEAAYNRVHLEVAEGDELYIVQHTGERLPEGTTTLPEHSGFRFYRVIFKESPHVETDR